MLAEYLGLLRRNPQPLGFAFPLASLSSFGQTFFIARSGAGIRADMAIADGALGSAYGVATLASGLMLGWVGRYIDRVRLATFTISVGRCWRPPASRWRCRPTSSPWLAVPGCCAWGGRG